MNYIFHLLTYLSIYVIWALSLNLIVGYMGRLNMAHAAFIAIGAYTYAIANVVLNWAFIPGLLLAVTVAILLSLLLSLTSWRFRGDFFIMITLAAQALIYGVIHNWSSAEAPLGSWWNLTNGSYGIAGITKPDILGITFDTPASMFVLSGVLAGLCAMTIFLLTRSPWGRLLTCARDDELALRGLGKGLRMLKVQVFALSCGFAAMGGVLLACHISYVDSTTASLDESILLICMLCVGGMGNFRGPLVGALVLLLLPEALRFIPLPDAVAANVRLLAYGLLIIFIVHFRPQGIAGVYRME